MPFYGNQHIDVTTYSYDDIVRGVRALGDELGRSPTTSEADADDRLPCLSTIYKYSDGGWADILADAGLEPTQVLAYSPDDERAMCRDLRRVFTDAPTHSLTHRRYDDYGTYPTSVVKEHFGSWRAACDAAGISAGQRHGTPCEGPHGELLDSRHELAVATYLHDAGLDYVVHPPLEGTRWIGDFYLPDPNLWIEVDGYAVGTRPNKVSFRDKLAHLRDTGADVAVVKGVQDVEVALRDRGVDVGSRHAKGDGPDTPM